MMQHVQQRKERLPWENKATSTGCGQKGTSWYLFSMCSPLNCYQFPCRESTRVNSHVKWASLYRCLHAFARRWLETGQLQLLQWSLFFVVIPWSTTSGTEETHPTIDSGPSGFKSSLRCPGEVLGCTVPYQVCRTLSFKHSVYDMKSFRRVELCVSIIHTCSWRQRHYKRKITRHMPCFSASWTLSVREKLLTPTPWRCE